MKLEKRGMTFQNEKKIILFVILLQTGKIKNWQHKNKTKHNLYIKYTITANVLKL